MSPNISVQLREVFLSESFVYDIQVVHRRVTFECDFVLTPRHPLYHSPLPGEAFCFHRGTLEFTGVEHVSWSGQTRPPMTDLDGAVVYGNIEIFWPSFGDYALAGEWGILSIRAAEAELRLR